MIVFIFHKRKIYCPKRYEFELQLQNLLSKLNGIILFVLQKCTNRLFFLFLSKRKLRNNHQTKKLNETGKKSFEKNYSNKKETRIFLQLKCSPWFFLFKKMDIQHRTVRFGGYSSNVWIQRQKVHKRSDVHRYQH